MENLAAQFEERLRDAIEQCKKHRYYPRDFEQMLNTSDGVTTAKKFIASGELQSGLQRIVKMGYPELSVESIVGEEVFRPLFTKGERDSAAWRLDAAKKLAGVAG